MSRSSAGLSTISLELYRKRAPTFVSWRLTGMPYATPMSWRPSVKSVSSPSSSPASRPWGHRFAACGRIRWSSGWANEYRPGSRSATTTSTRNASAASADARGQADPDSDAAEGVVERYGERIAVRDFAGDGRGVSEMDALIAYLQMLGTLVDFESFQASNQSVD